MPYALIGKEDYRKKSGALGLLERLVAESYKERSPEAVEGAGEKELIERARGLIHARIEVLNGGYLLSYAAGKPIGYIAFSYPRKAGDHVVAERWFVTEKERGRNRRGKRRKGKGGEAYRLTDELERVMREKGFPSVMSVNLNHRLLQLYEKRLRHPRKTGGEQAVLDSIQIQRNRYKAESGRWRRGGTVTVTFGRPKPGQPGGSGKRPR